MSTTLSPPVTDQHAADASSNPDLLDAPEPLTEDEVFHLLQCRRRRDALRYLDAHGGGPVRMRDLAEQVAAWEHETTVARLSSKERQRVYIPLYQTHLPKLDEAGVIEYDQHRGEVARGSLAGQLAPYLRPGPSDADAADADPAVADTDAIGDDSDPAVEQAHSETPWGRYFAGASFLALVALGGTVLVGSGVSSIAGLVLAVAVFSTFGLLTLARLYDR